MTLPYTMPPRRMHCSIQGPASSSHARGMHALWPPAFRFLASVLGMYRQRQISTDPGTAPMSFSIAKKQSCICDPQARLGSFCCVYTQQVNAFHGAMVHTASCSLQYSTLRTNSRRKVLFEGLNDKKQAAAHQKHRIQAVVQELTGEELLQKLCKPAWGSTKASYRRYSQLGIRLMIRDTHAETKRVVAIPLQG